MEEEKVTFTKTHSTTSRSSRLSQKTPSSFKSITTKDTDSHIGQVFHDLVFDAMIHEFDEEPTKINDTPSLSSSSLTVSSLPSSSSSSITNKNKLINNNHHARLQKLNDFECYLNFKRILSLITLFAICSYQFIYFRHYYISGIFSFITFILYLLLFIKKINILISKYYYFSFLLLVIRLFHLISIFTLMFGVITCQYHFKLERKTNHYKYTITYILMLERVLYVLLIIAMLSCLLQNFYIIKYTQFIICRFRGIYCNYLEFIILKNGLWRNDIEPISSFDRLLTFLLLLTTFSSIMISIICINRMEIDSI